MRRGWDVRRYEPASADDVQQVKNFSCYTPGQKWTKPPQKIIRAAPQEIANGTDATIFVATARIEPHVGRVVGVIVFGVEDEELIIHALGVVKDMRRIGVGTALKTACLADVSVTSGATVSVTSFVHRRNTPMQKLNERMGVGTTKDPEDGEMLISAIIVEPGVPLTPGPMARLRARVLAAIGIAER